MEGDGYTALLAGASGLVGRHLLDTLLGDDRYAKVKVLARRAPGTRHENLEVILADFEKLDEVRDSLAADDVFCCLGTTLKKAGSREAFARVDRDYPVELGRLGRAAGARLYVLVSALGADRHSRIFYNRTKGEVEEGLEGLGFPTLHIFRPSFLLGRRESRPGESLAIAAARALRPLLAGPLARTRPVAAATVAAAMAAAARDCRPGTHIHHVPDIERLARMLRA